MLHVHAWVHLVLGVKEWEDVCERGGDQSASIALKSTKHQQFTFSRTQRPDIGPSTLIKTTVWRAGKNNETGNKIPEQKTSPQHLDSGLKNVYYCSWRNDGRCEKGNMRSYCHHKQFLFIFFTFPNRVCYCPFFGIRGRKRVWERQREEGRGKRKASSWRGERKTPLGIRQAVAPPLRMTDGRVSDLAGWLCIQETVSTVVTSMQHSSLFPWQPGLGYRPLVGLCRLISTSVPLLLCCSSSLLSGIKCC